MLPRVPLLSLTAGIKRRGLLDVLVRYNPASRIRVQRSIAAFDRADADDRYALTERLTARALAGARRTPYGRGRGGYADWPVLDCVSVRDAPALFARPGLFRVPASTSGTTGVPLKLWRSARSIAAEQAFIDRMLAPHGLTWATARVASMRPHATKPLDDWTPPFAVQTHGGRRLTVSSPHLARATLPWFMDRLERFRPEILWTTPTVLANLVVLLRNAARGFPVPPPVIMSSSAHLSPGLRAAVEVGWGSPVIDYYGQAERTCLATSTVSGEFWFQPAYGRVDLAGTDAEPLPGDRVSVPIVATGFWNGAMALVRYDTGDRGIVPAGADLRAIALGTRPFLGIAGRKEEFLVTPDGGRFGGLNCLPWEIENLLQMQIVQDRSHAVRVRVLVRPEFGEADRDHLHAQLRTKIPHALRITVEVVDRLETNAAGKTPFLIRDVEPASVTIPRYVREPAA